MRTEPSWWRAHGAYLDIVTEIPAIDGTEPLEPRGPGPSAIWRQLQSVIAPVVGETAMRAMYLRSVHRVGKQYPWLLELVLPPAEVLDFNALQATLARQSGSHAALAHEALLLAFHDLLVELLGDSLVASLLPAGPETLLAETTLQEQRT